MLLPDGDNVTLARRVRASLAETANVAIPYAGDMGAGDQPPGTPAAVLIAITERTEPGLILTQRPETMRHHPGQVALPGGRIDPGDSDAVEAALREAEEEVELPRRHVEIVGILPAYRTVTGFDITAVIGVIPPDLRLVPHVHEVTAVFEVPLSFVLDPTNRTERSLRIDGIDRRYFEIMWGDRRIWGATAAMLANLSARLKW